MTGDLPARVFVGSYEDCLFLATLLEGSGIPANFVQSHSAVAPHSVFIPRRHVAEAQPLIDDFKSQAGRGS